MSLLGLDVGTTGCKAVVFSERGTQICEAYREYPLIYPKESWVELQPDIIWMKVKEVLLEVNSSLITDPVTALAVSSQGETVTAIDKNGSCLYNFIVTFDNRTVEQVKFWEDKFSKEKIYKITGMPLHPMYSINKIIWIKTHLNEIYKKVFKFLLVEDFIIYKLTGEFCIDFTLASRTMAFDINKRKWSPEILSIANVNENLFSHPCPPGTVVGCIKEELKRELGFKNNVCIVTGGHDQPCGALGAGISVGSIAMNATGTVDAICPVINDLTFSDTMLFSNYPIYPYVIANYYCTIAFNLTGGLLLKWYRDVLCQDEVKRAADKGIDTYEIIIGEMSCIPKDIFVLPHFVGSGTPYLDALSKGAIVGLKISTTKGELTRAILDSLNLEMKFNIECLSKNNIEINEVRAVGGGAKSKKWLELKANCFGVPVTRPNASEAVSLGAAILAGYATNVFHSIHEGVQNMVILGDTIYPDQELIQVYEEKYEKYTKLYELIKDYNKELK